MTFYVIIKINQQNIIYREKLFTVFVRCRLLISIRITTTASSSTASMGTLIETAVTDLSSILRPGVGMGTNSDTGRKQGQYMRQECHQYQYNITH